MVMVLFLFKFDEKCTNSLTVLSYDNLAVVLFGPPCRFGDLGRYALDSELYRQNRGRDCEI